MLMTALLTLPAAAGLPDVLAPVRGQAVPGQAVPGQAATGQGNAPEAFASLLAARFDAPAPLTVASADRVPPAAGKILPPGKVDGTGLPDEREAAPDDAEESPPASPMALVPLVPLPPMLAMPTATPPQPAARREGAPASRVARAGPTGGVITDAITTPPALPPTPADPATQSEPALTLPAPDRATPAPLRSSHERQPAPVRPETERPLVAMLPVRLVVEPVPPRPEAQAAVPAPLRPPALAAAPAPAEKTATGQSPMPQAEVPTDQAAPPLLAATPPVVSLAEPAEHGGGSHFAAPPATAPVPPRDFAALIDRLVEARDAAAPQRLDLAVEHREFGAVSLRFDTDDRGLTIAVASADPGFAVAAQTALAAERPSHGDARPSAEGHGPATRDPGSSGSAAQSQSRQESGAPSGERRPVRPALQDSAAKPGRDEHRPRSGIFA